MLFEQADHPPVGNDIVAYSFVVISDGITVIDAGLPDTWSDLQAELRSVGRSVDDITGLVVTHGDSDHVGFAERLRRDHGVPVSVREGDADRAQGGPRPANAKQRMRIADARGPRYGTS